MGLLDTDYATVNGKKPRRSDRIQEATPLNMRGLLDAATNIPVAGDALSGAMAAYDAAKGDYGSAAMNALGVLPFVTAGTVKGVGKAADALSGKKLTEFEQRHLIAQQNASLPVNHGGLGLPANNTAMDRAKAMGFDTPAYHATLSDIKSFDNDILGKYNAHPVASIGTFFSDSPDALNLYLKGAKGVKGRQENIIPVMLRTGNKLEYHPKYKDGMESSKLGVPDGDPINSLSGDIKKIGPWKENKFGSIEEKYDPYWAFRQNVDLFKNKLDQSLIDSIVINKSFDMPEYRRGRSVSGPTDQYIIRDPVNIRSRFAAFDPMRRHEADLLGYADPYLLSAIGGGGLLVLGGYKAYQSE